MQSFTVEPVEIKSFFLFFNFYMNIPTLQVLYFFILIFKFKSSDLSNLKYEG